MSILVILSEPCLLQQYQLDIAGTQTDTHTQKYTVRAMLHKGVNTAVFLEQATGSANLQVPESASASLYAFPSLTLPLSIPPSLMVTRQVESGGRGGVISRAQLALWLPCGCQAVIKAQNSCD